MLAEHIEFPDDPQARALLEAAVAQSYKLPFGFPGFQADLAVQMNDQIWHGRVTGYTPRHLTITLPDAEARTWAECEMQSILGHRWPSAFAERDGRYILALDPTEHPLGVKIILHGDPLQSHYRVHDDRITQVHRVMGDQNFTIHILDVQHIADGRHLPKHFTVVFREESSNRLIRSDAYTDRYAYVDNCWLPALRRVITTDAHGMHTYVMELSNHRLLHEEHATTVLPTPTQQNLRA